MTWNIENGHVLSRRSPQSRRASFSVVPCPWRAPAGPELARHVRTVVENVAGKASILLHSPLLLVLGRVQDTLPGIDGNFDVEIKVDVRLHHSRAHFDTGRVVDAAAAGLGLGRADVDLRLVARKVRTFFVVGIANVSAVTQRDVGAAVVVVVVINDVITSFEASIQTQFGLEIAFRRSRQNFARTNSFQFSEFFPDFGRRRQRDRFRFRKSEIWQ